MSTGVVGGCLQQSTCWLCHCATLWCLECSPDVRMSSTRRIDLEQQGPSMAYRGRARPYIGTYHYTSRLGQIAGFGQSSHSRPRPSVEFDLATDKDVGLRYVPTECPDPPPQGSFSCLVDRFNGQGMATWPGMIRASRMVPPCEPSILPTSAVVRQGVQVTRQLEYSLQFV